MHRNILIVGLLALAALLPLPAVHAQTDAECGVEPQLIAGERGRVLPGTANNVRAQPNRDAELLGQLQAGATFDVLEIGGCSGGITWARVRAGDLTGWTAEGQDGEYYLEPLGPAGILPGLALVIDTPPPVCQTNVNTTPPVGPVFLLVDPGVPFAPGDTVQLATGLRAAVCATTTRVTGILTAPDGTTSPLTARATTMGNLDYALPGVVYATPGTWRVTVGEATFTLNVTEATAPVAVADGAIVRLRGFAPNVRVVVGSVTQDQSVVTTTVTTDADGARDLRVAGRFAFALAADGSFASVVATAEADGTTMNADALQVYLQRVIGP